MNNNEGVLQIINYSISYDENLSSNKYGITPEIKKTLEKTFEGSRNNSISIKTLYELIEKYPRIPQFKNHLAVLYSVKGNYSKAQEINDWIVEKHPDYLFGKIAEAQKFLLAGEYERVERILGKAMEIGALYPERDVFHANEIMAFNKLAVSYFVEIGNLEAAESRLDLMIKIGPEEEETDFASKKIFAARLEKGLKLMKKERETARNVISISSQVSEQSEEKPVFYHSQIEQLYCNSLRIDQDLLLEILTLPEESLIDDLNKILADTICRYNYFSQETVWNKETHEFLNHALFLLIELKSTESLRTVLNLLRQDEEFLEFWFSDFLTEMVWEALFVFGNKQLEELKEYIKEPDNYAYARSAVSEAISQIALHQPERRPEVINWYRDVFNYFIENKEDERIIDTDLIGLMVGDVMDMDGKELESLLTELFESELVNEFMQGDLEEVLKELHNPSYLRNRKRDIYPDILARYDDIINTWEYYKEKNNQGLKDIAPNPNPMFLSNERDFYYTKSEPIIAAAKIGRNEPCPCGSGKKYKKCCSD